ncbi:ATP-binding protein [Streptomyces sp. LN704]|uniref:ATP-binding protein n=1 Tax=Streptomyces sp. LN704 TaxID=3112982 RepID=UPI003713FA15
MADEQPIVGRETELAELSGLAASPDGRALLLRGEAGVGKSVLLDAAAARSLALGHRVVRTAGVEAESELPFAGLHQILHPLLPQAAGLDRVTRAAFDTVFGRTTGEAPSVMALGVAVLDLLALVSGDRPLLVVVDDAHWFDPQSAEVGRFIAHAAVRARGSDGHRGTGGRRLGMGRGRPPRTGGPGPRRPRGRPAARRARPGSRRGRPPPGPRTGPGQPTRPAGAAARPARGHRPRQRAP